VIGTLFLLIESPGNLNSITGAHSSISSVTNSNYFLGFVLFQLTLIFSWYIYTIFRRRRKRQTWHSIPSDEDELSLATWEINPELSMGEKIHQINKELKGLMTEESKMLKKRPKKITKIANIKEMRLNKELYKIQNKIHGYAKPLVLRMPKKKIELERNLSGIKNKLEKLDSMKIKKVKMREEPPSRNALEKIAQKGALKKEFLQIQNKMKEVPGKRKKIVKPSKALDEIDKRIFELQNKSKRGVKIRTEIPKEKHFTDMPVKDNLKRELSEVSDYLSDEKESPKFKRKVRSSKKRSKEKSKELLEIEERIARLG